MTNNVSYVTSYVNNCSHIIESQWKVIHELCTAAFNEQDKYAALEVANKLAYAITNLRAWLSVMQCECVSLVGNSQNNTSVSLQLKKLELFLQSNLTRLSELREDLAVLSRISYTVRNDALRN